MTAADVTPRVCVVGDSTEWPAWLASRPEHHPNVFCVDVPPLTMPSVVDAAEAVLTGLGKDGRLTFAKRSAEALAAAWLSVTHHTDALIVDVTVLRGRVLEDVVHMLVAFGIRPWLVIPSGDYDDLDERTDLATELVDHFDGVLLSPAETVAAWPDTADPTAADTDDDGDWPLVPRIDAVYFRSAVRDLLDPDDATFVDTYFVSTVKEIRDELSQPNLQIRSVEKLLRNRMHDAVTDDELITIVRAAQVAAATTRFRIFVNPIRLFGACNVLPRRGHIVRDDWWTRLDRYRDPDVGTVAALHMAGMDLADIHTLATDDVTEGPDGSATATGASGAPFTLTGPAARFLRASVAWRIFGAGPGPLFSTHRADGISNQRLGHLAREPMTVGIRHTGVKAWRNEPTAENWLANYGITVDRSTKAKRRAEQKSA
ncbi:hypothetical protein NHL50_09815 [Acidimicrobiia bacterium EGI L10123]|uniref:hypothetical protein n=1 Tax=Salinilacustrithrix flava TaxID=2957203 RepID=UPI003D7C18B5|nr:hypothetical protein [Acidimicrobiia bacterium EGI L10123]